MMQTKWMAAAVSILALAACDPADNSNSATPAYESADNAMVANTATAVPENALSSEGNAAAASSTATAMPAAFQGRWGLVVNDCDPARDDNKGLMTVAADSLKFYESRGTVKQVTIASPTKLTADLAFTGEGQTWDKTATFTLLDDGNTLLREESDPALSLRYSKCPA